MRRYTDMHCDTLLKAFAEGQTDLYDVTDSMFGWSSFQQAGGLLQYLAVFFPPVQPDMPAAWPGDAAYFAGAHAIFDETIRRHPQQLQKVTSVADYNALERSGRMGGLLTIEDGRMLTDLSAIDTVFRQDVRLVSLTWNAENALGAPHSRDPAEMSKGLTPFGKEAVAYMREKGIIVDVSHLSDGGFYDVADSGGAFVASHSNCRALCPHSRNLTDDMIRVLGEHGGVMGLNFCPDFVDPAAHPVSTASLLARHARHAANQGGVGVVAVGSDFDGIHGDIEIHSPDQMELLWTELKRAGFTEREIDQIATHNVARVIRETLPAENGDRV